MRGKCVQRSPTIYQNNGGGYAGQLCQVTETWSKDGQVSQPTEPTDVATIPPDPWEEGPNLNYSRTNQHMFWRIEW